MDLLEQLQQLLPAASIVLEQPMSKKTSFKIGGPADFFVSPQNEEQLCAVIRLCKDTNTPYYIMGNGSNLLVADKGIRGVVIQLFKQMAAVQVNGAVLDVQAGALLSKIATVALEHGLSGFEFASGIPGTLGGAVMMNAGAYGGEMKQVLVDATILDEQEQVRTLSVDELELAYRSSILSRKPYILLSARIQLLPGDVAAIKERLAYLTEQRKTKQPLEFPSAGSAFKRPEGYFAGALIDESGLRGFRMGGAQVSQKHCGFVINYDHASAADVIQLMDYVADVVQSKHGVQLESEVKRIGEF